MPCRLSMMNTGKRPGENGSGSMVSNQPMTSRVTRSGAASSGSSELVHAPAVTIAAPASIGPAIGDDAHGACARLDRLHRLAAADVRPRGGCQRDQAAIDGSTSRNPPSGCTTPT